MKTFRRLLSYLKDEPLFYSLSFILSIFSAGTVIYSPMIGKEIIDAISKSVENQQQLPPAFLIQKFGWFMLITILSAITGYFSQLLFSYASNRVGKRIRDAAHEKMQQLPISYFDDKPAGKISARIVNDTEVIRNHFYQNFSSQVLLNTLMVIGTYLALFLVSRQVGLALLFLLPFFILWQFFYVRFSTPLNKNWREIVSELNSLTAEIIQGVSIVQLFHQQVSMLEEFEEKNQAWLDNRVRTIRLDGIFSWDFSTFIKNIVTFCLLLYLGTQFTNGVLGYSMGTIFILINYISSLFDPILNLVRIMPTLQQSLAAGERVFELLDEANEIDSDLPLHFLKGEIQFEHVTFGYEATAPVLKEIHFHVRPGETVGLVGHTGSGKSSLINLLFRFYDPQKGSILIDKQPIQQCNRESVREQMGIVLQEPYLFSGTIGSNVSMQDETITEAMIVSALQKVGAQPLLDKLPKGIHEEVIEKGQSLSSGERQLIAFARTLAKNPKILILDEATSHIDTETEEIIQNAMNVVKEGRTTFIIAHRLSTIQQADQILLLDQGVIREQGTHEELLALNGQYAEMYHLQTNAAR
ncbi:ABC transporter ATP-binding protein [Enterococcus sp. LJL98]